MLCDVQDCTRMSLFIRAPYEHPTNCCGNFDLTVCEIPGPCILCLLADVLNLPVSIPDTHMYTTLYSDPNNNKFFSIRLVALATTLT